MKHNVNLSDIILENVDIVSVISQYVQLKQMGKNNKGLCPFHSEKTPSFIVSEDKQLFHCFGCGAAGNAIQFIMRVENLDFLDAIDALSDQYNIPIEQYKYSKPGSKPTATRDEKVHLLDVMRTSAMHYYKNLTQDKEGLAYLTNRGLDAGVIKKFGLGLAKDEWDGLINSFTSNDLNVLEQVGLVIKRKDQSGYYDRFRNRIIFPIIDVRGKVIGFGGRVTDDSLPKYLNSPETVLFNKSKTLYGLNLAKNHIDSCQDTIIVTEGYMDVIALHNVGIPNAVATLGTALTKEHGKLLDRYAKTVVICYDSDEAGIKATLRSIDILKDIKAKVKVLQLGEGMDPDDYIKKYGKIKFLVELSSAKPGFVYRVETLSKEFDFTNEEDQVDFIKKAVELFDDLSDNIKVEYFIRTLSNFPQLNDNYIRSIVQQFASEEVKVYQKRETAVARIKKRQPIDILEERLLFLTFLNKKNSVRILNQLTIEDFTNDIIKDFFEIFVNGYNTRDEIEISNFADVLEVDQLLLLEKLIKRGIPSTNENNEINEVIYKHKMFGIEQSLKAVRGEREKYLKLLNAGTLDNKEEVLETCNELTRRESTLHQTLREMKKSSNWKGGKSIE